MIDVIFILYLLQMSLPREPNVCMKNKDVQEGRERGWAGDMPRAFDLRF